MLTNGGKTFLITYFDEYFFTNQQQNGMKLSFKSETEFVFVFCC